MKKNEEDDLSTIPLEFVVLGGLARVIGWFLAIVTAAVTWLLVTGAMVVWSLRAPPNSFEQSLAADIAVTLMLFAAAPLLLAYWKVTSVRRLLLSLVGAVAVVAVSAIVPGRAQSLVMGLGCGIALLLVLDFWIHGAWKRAMEESKRRAADEYERRTMVP
jgi:hypothetical protein